MWFFVFDELCGLYLVLVDVGDEDGVWFGDFVEFFDYVFWV